MIDPISNAINARDAANQARQQVVPSPGAPTPETNLAPDQRVEVVQAAVEKLIKKTLPSNSKLEVEKDKELGTFIYRSVNPDTGEIIKQWPPEKLLELRGFLKEMEGLLVDTTA